MEVESGERVARPTQFDELIPAAVVLLGWVLIIGKEGWTVGFHTAWILLIALPLAAWTLLMRLRFSPSRLQRTIGPWRSEVDLTSLQSIKWKMTGGWRSEGMIFVRDRHGGRVGIYVGRFKKVDEWGPLLLESAAGCDAEVDSHSRRILAAHSSQD